MFKIIILSLVFLWITGLFLGRKARPIKDLKELMSLIIWVVLAFAGLTALSDTRPLGDGLLPRLALSSLWLAVTWFLSRFLARVIIR